MHDLSGSEARLETIGDNNVLCVEFVLLFTWQPGVARVELSSLQQKFFFYQCGAQVFTPN